MGWDGAEATSLHLTLRGVLGVQLSSLRGAWSPKSQPWCRTRHKLTSLFEPQSRISKMNMMMQVTRVQL